MKITTLNDGILLIEESFSTITFLMITKYAVIVIFLATKQIVIVTIFVFKVTFEADKSKSLIHNKSNVFRMRNSYKT